MAVKSRSFVRAGMFYWRVRVADVFGSTSSQIRIRKSGWANLESSAPILQSGQ
jgi:hypothetical protein